MYPEEKAEICNDISNYKKRKKKKREKSKIYIIFCSTKKIIIIFYISKFFAIFIILSIIFFMKKINSKGKQINLSNAEIEQNIENFVQTIPKVDKNEIVEFRRINSHNILLDSKETKIKENRNPDISIILTSSNQAHCIHKALRSIQNQSLKNIEIIVSIDCSYDNSTEIIKSYMKKDKRIVLIEHDTKEGTMKNTNDGIRKAKGKCITIIDGDDTLIQKNILKNTLDIATLGNLDIVEFYGNMYANGEEKSTIHYHNDVNGIIRQPELRNKFFDVNENNTYFAMSCRVIWGKLIKNEIFQKTLEKIGPKYTDDYMIVFEDSLISITLYQVAQSFYLYRDFGYYYSRDEFSGRFPLIPNKKCKIKAKPNKGLDSLKFITYLYDTLEDNAFDKKVICHEIIGANNFDFLKFSNIVNDHFDMFYRVVDGLLNTSYLTEKEREKLVEIKKEVVIKENSLKK